MSGLRNEGAALGKPIKVSAMVFRDRSDRVLTVRKHGTTWLMLPGGKPETGETDTAAAVRECAEELGIVLDPAALRRLGSFTAPAANEPGRDVLATVFEHPAVDVEVPRAEIAELDWVSLHETDVRVAPLLRDHVFPALRRNARSVQRVTVFTGSATGDSEVFATGVAELAESLVAAGVGIVYGGGKVGLMGILADKVISAGGEVFGVMPQALVDGEIAHDGLTRLDVVPDMHSRKLRMTELGDAFIALPGGVGTLEELFEAWTWQQLGIHPKPVVLYNIDGYWQPLLHALDTMTDRGFLSETFRSTLIVCDHPHTLLTALDGWTPPPAKWSKPTDYQNSTPTTVPAQ